MNKKPYLFSALYIAGLFAVYNIVLFVIAGFGGHPAGFWAAYAFALAAFALVTLFTCVVFVDTKPFRYWFLSFPMFKWSALYLAAAILTSTVFMLLDNITVLSVVHVLLIGAYCGIGGICYAQKSHVVQIEEQKQKISYIRILKAEVEALAKTQQDTELKQSLTKFAEALRFSDPNSHERLAGEEKLICEKVDRLKVQLTNGNKAEALQTLGSLNGMLVHRNELCKAYKGL